MVGIRRSPLVWIVPGAILVLAILAYTPSLEFRYVQDAHHLVRANPVIERGDPVEILTSDFCKDTASPAGSLYRPVTIASWVLERRMAGEPSPRLSHLFGVVFHVLTSIVLFFLARRLGTGDGAAALAALLFAAHPLMMQGVVNVAARGDVLVALFVTGSLLVYSWAGPWPGEPRRGPVIARLAAWGTALCLFLALGSKEPAVITPLLLVALDLLYRYPRRSGGSAWWVERAASLAPSALACCVYLVLRTTAIESLWGLPGAPVEDNVLAAGVTGIARWATVLAILARYVGLLVFPANMSGDYSGNSIPVETSLLAPLPLAGLAVAIVFVSTAVLPLVRTLRGQPRRPWLSIGSLLFSLPYVVIGNVIALNAASMAERWLYFPATGAFVLAGAGLSASLERVAEGTRRTRTIAAVLLIPCLVALALYTRHESFMWKNNVAFFEQNLRATPDSLRSYVVLGQRHRAAGRLDAALELYARALDRAPGHAPFWLEKGVTLWEMGQSREAEKCFRRAVELAPDLAQAWMNLGVVLAERSDTASAEVALRKALLHQPHLTGAAVLLGDLAYRDGRFDEAAHFYAGCVALGREEIRPRLEAAQRMRTAGRGNSFAR